MADGVRSLYKWEGYAVTRPDHIPGTNDCASPIARFGNSTGCVTLSPTWREMWAAVHATLSPHIASGAVIGVMLGDERMWDGVSMQNLTDLTDQMKHDWPESLLFINEAQDAILCGFNRLNETLFPPEGPQCWPPALDWVGFDLYDQTVSNGGTAFSQFNVSKRGIENCKSRTEPLPLAAGQLREPAAARCLPSLPAAPSHRAHHARLRLLRQRL